MERVLADRPPLNPGERGPHAPVRISPEIPFTAANVLRFGDFSLVASGRRLETSGTMVPLGGRAFDLLLALARRSGEVVSKAELYHAAWPGRVVEDTALRFHIACLRKALRQADPMRAHIVTVAGRGYCFTSDVARK